MGPPLGPLETATVMWETVGSGLTGVGTLPPCALGHLTALASHYAPTNSTSARRGGGRALSTTNATCTRLLDADTAAAVTYCDAICGAATRSAVCAAT